MMDDLKEIKKLLRDIRNALENAKSDSGKSGLFVTLLLFLILMQVCGIASRVG